FAFFKRFVAPETTLFDFNSGYFPIFSYNLNGNNTVSAFGIGKDVKNGLTIPIALSSTKYFENAVGEPLKDATDGSLVENPFKIVVGNITLKPPHLDAASGSAFASHAEQAAVFNYSGDLLGTTA